MVQRSDQPEAFCGRCGIPGKTEQAGVGIVHPEDDHLFLDPGAYGDVPAAAGLPGADERGAESGAGRDPDFPQQQMNLKL